MGKTATLVLQDGTTFTGSFFGAEVETKGEVVFNTGMVGYPETFTDPSYKGQILVLTYPLVGNYGVPNFSAVEEGVKRYFESNHIHIQGLIVNEYSENFHHWNAKQSLGKWLKANNIPAITGIDTRELTQYLREQGSTLGAIVSGNKKPARMSFYDPNEENLVAQVSVKEVQHFKRGKKHVVIVDTGMKNNILRNFLDRNISVTVVPWDYDFFADETITNFDGVFFSNGPGDPAILKETHAIMKKCMAKKIPSFGICLGSQIMAIAAGAKTYKMKFGHRSHNQPVIDVETGRCYISSQNHGYAVETKTMPKDFKVWFTNANDDTVEGIKHKKHPFFAVQFHPEATSGPNDTNWLFDEFAKVL